MKLKQLSFITKSNVYIIYVIYFSKMVLDHAHKVHVAQQLGAYVAPFFGSCIFCIDILS